MVACLSKVVNECYYHVASLWNNHRRSSWVLAKYKAVTKVSFDFCAFLVNFHHVSTLSVDKHLKMTVCCIVMSNNFRDFVDGYQRANSIGCEHGY